MLLHLLLRAGRGLCRTCSVASDELDNHLPRTSGSLAHLPPNVHTLVTNPTAQAPSDAPTAPLLPFGYT